MTESSFLWPTTNSGDVSPHSVADTAAVFAALTMLNHANAGILPNQQNELAPSVSGTNILIASGWAIVDGHPYRNTASKTVTPALPTTGVTGRRLVLRCTWATGTQTVRITEISSADGTATIPAMTQTSGTTYDIPLCQYTVANGSGTIAAYVDNRVYAGENAALSYMRSLGGGALAAPVGLVAAGRVMIADANGGAATGVTQTEAAGDRFMSGRAGTGFIVSDSGNNLAIGSVLTVTGLDATIATQSPTASRIIGVTSGYGTTAAAAGPVGTIGIAVAPDRSPWMRACVNMGVLAGATITRRACGFFDSTISATMSGAHLRQVGAGNVVFVTRQGGSETTTTIGAAANAIRWYDIYSPDAGVTWKCTAHTEGVVASHTTNVPTAATDLAYGHTASLATPTAGTIYMQFRHLAVSMIDE